MERFYERGHTLALISIAVALAVSTSHSTNIT